MMGKTWSLMLTAVLVSVGCHGCAGNMAGKEQTSATMDNKGTQPSHPLQWVMDADPKQDATQAIHDGDLRLLAFGGRVVSIPGIDMAVYPLPTLREKCGYRVIRGTSDTLRVGESTAYRSQAYDYAKRYNQIVLTHCL
ncbi:hypothetical protein [Alteromonas sp. C1M14]|uniref:hypothetical protein n=1 Tax=Alteromonas sp. C1M14 TaxID=2841567 RepID=UPI001C097CDD|nr:hypothetical protein [Alteromonas sp. C1M14]MBU2979305.1 hypothetical protein [Alteromonas sp. C1M14]